MKEKKEKKLASLLKLRRNLSEKNQHKTKAISANDPQLLDVLKNFNESKEYKA